MMKLNDEYLALTAKLTRAVKHASYEQLGLRAGSRHLEVGSGNGHDSIALAERHPDTDIVGIDLNPDLVTVANQRVAEKGLGNIRHLDGDASTHDFGTSFHSMRAERVFQHLDDKLIGKLVAHLRGHATPGCLFSLVGVDWETLTCTVSKAHLDTFRTIKRYLVEISNITYLHSAIDAFEANGFTTRTIDTYQITTGNFDIALTAFNLDGIASHLALDQDRFKAWRDDFREGRHYFSVGGNTALFALPA